MGVVVEVLELALKAIPQAAARVCGISYKVDGTLGRRWVVRVQEQYANTKGVIAGRESGSREG